MSKRSTRSSGSGGYSIVEMLIAMAIGLAVTGGALSLALSSRRLYEADQARTRLNQSLRASKDFLVVDIRQAGERLGPNFPAIEIVGGEDLPGGLAGDPDELILRRNLLDTVLFVCADVDPGLDELVVAVKSSPPSSSCVALPVEAGESYPPNLQNWSDHRVAAGGVVAAYLYNPVTEEGEFFDYESESEETGEFVVSKASGSDDWETGCLEDHECRLYILEERRYRISQGLLQVIVDGDEGNPIHLVDSIVDFQLRVFPKPTESDPTPDPLESFDGDGWDKLRTVEVSVDGRTELRDRLLERGWTAEVMPRNVL